METWTTVLLGLSAITLCQSYYLDLMTSFPGLQIEPNYQMFSGYLNGTGGNMLHYWFVQSQHSIADPLIIWLSNGPGCSALYSMLTSNGPFRVHPNGLQLDVNPNSWNQNANLLYIDAPVYTGFSYSAGSSQSSDTAVTDDHYQALLSFFSKFPNTKQSVIYLAGEGYAGVYVPLLMQKIDASQLNLKFEGLAVGNPLTSIRLQDESLVYYAYNHGIIGEELWSELQMSCCSNGSCNFYNSTNTNCIKALNETLHDVFEMGINPYHVNGDCAAAAGGVPAKNFKEYPRKLKADRTCVNTTTITKFLNIPSVRTALHIVPASPVWVVCNASVYQHYTKQYPDMFSVYTNLLATYKYRILVYNGDQDAVHNFLGNEWFVTSLDRETEVQWRPWLYKSALAQNQVAGFVKEYDHIAFLTIKNAGFWAPRDQPLATSLLIYNFIYKRPY